MKRVNTFVDYKTELVEKGSKKAKAEVIEGSSKRAGDELEQEVTTKKKMDDVHETANIDDDQEAAKMKELLEIVPDEEEVAIDVVPLATKPPSIVDWKIHKEEKKSYYQIIRANGSSNIYAKQEAAADHWNEMCYQLLKLITKQLLKCFILLMIDEALNET
ncbi:hypothetical protein Tco_0428283 [Tanacetum coccineum]